MWEQRGHFAGKSAVAPSHCTSIRFHANVDGAGAGRPVNGHHRACSMKSNSSLSSPSHSADGAGAGRPVCWHQPQGAAQANQVGASWGEWRAGASGGGTAHSEARRGADARRAAAGEMETLALFVCPPIVCLKRAAYHKAGWSADARGGAAGVQCFSWLVHSSIACVWRA